MPVKWASTGCVEGRRAVSQPGRMDTKSQINVRVDGELRERLEQLAHEQDRTLSGQVRHLLARAAERAAPAAAFEKGART